MSLRMFLGMVFIVVMLGAAMATEQHGGRHDSIDADADYME
jgi:hypothetical protein